MLLLALAKAETAQNILSYIIRLQAEVELVSNIFRFRSISKPQHLSKRIFYIILYKLNVSA